MKKPPYYVTDPWHFLDERGEVPHDLPSSARKLILFFGQMIEEVSSLTAGRTFLTSLKCWRRPKRKPCRGEIMSWRDYENDSINWQCSQCLMGGEIHNWRGSPWDRSKELWS